MRTLTVLILTLFISSCSGIKHPTQLSELTIENENLNKLITDRKPDYGISGRDGCEIMGEISMNISKLNKGKFIRGKVFDVETKKPLISAQLKLLVEQSGVNEASEIFTNENGVYELRFSGKLKKIQVRYITHRTLKIDLEKL